MNKTVDQLEITKFSNISYDWWNPEGKFATLHKINPIRVKFMLDLIFKTNHIDAHSDRLLANFRVLDIGCGGGLSSEPLQSLEPMSAVLTLTTRQYVKNHAKNENLKIDYKNCSVEDLSLKKDGKFDVILLASRAHRRHKSLPLNCIKIPEKNGVVFVSTINKNIKSMVLAKFAAEYILNWVPKGTHDWNKFITPSNLSQMMERHGFDEVLEGLYLIQ